MRILLVGAGGEGAASCSIIPRRDFAEAVVVADCWPVRHQEPAV